MQGSADSRTWLYDDGGHVTDSYLLSQLPALKDTCVYIYLDSNSNICNFSNGDCRLSNHSTVCQKSA